MNMGPDDANGSLPEADTYQARRRYFVTALLFLFAVTLIGVGLVDMFTLRPRPGGGMSGNGNPALLMLCLLVPVYAVFLVMLGIGSRRFFACGLRRGHHQAVTLLVLILFGVALLALEWLYVKQLIGNLGGAPDRPGSVIYRWGWWNQYTNTACINVFTYLFGIDLALIIGYGAAWVPDAIKRKKR
ncbi:MAG: hypothetical protein E6230_25575 [Paenibacillus dendritiformis]|uniref:hypothetical protein n=1 Tax=uncultured Paenibacillus sp. TaxID=227322 RepID=UPI0025CCA440|nr:hypothetical protein [uncultured Paenibacillus sp.]MDU5145547.1 hypothetical protein [Paenibacillus dendritiformis]